LIEDFKQYVATRKDAGQRVLLIVDEFSAIADGERMARTVEVVRSYGVGVVLAPQAFDGMGGPEASARILNAAHTIFLHAIPDPEPVVKAAGTRMATEFSLQHSTRQQHQHRADPNEVRRLPPGMCIVIGSGQAQKVQIAPVRLGASAPLAELPAPADAARPEPSGDDDEPVRL
jgi:type IV secretory pathway TraG/TraD family ATPase VirD4